MGRFYKTASANPIDYMYELNVPLMEKVIEANDAQITGSLNQMDKAKELATLFNHLSDDDQDALKIGLDYTQKIDTITDAIRKNPNNWRSQIDPMRVLARGLQKDYTTGAISKMVGNYKVIAENNAAIDKMVEKGTLDAVSANRFKAHFLEQWRNNNDGKGTAYNPETGEYNVASAYVPMANINVEEELGKEMEKIKGEKWKVKTSTLTGNEEYFQDDSSEGEQVTPEQILKIAMGRLKSRTDIQNFLRERESVGLIKNAFMQPFDYVKADWTPAEREKFDAMEKAAIAMKTPEEREAALAKFNAAARARNNQQSLQWNEDAYLTGPLRSLVNRFARRDVSEEHTLRGGTNYMPKLKMIQEERHFQVQEARQAEKQKHDIWKDQEKVKQDWQKLNDDRDIAIAELNKAGSGDGGAGAKPGEVFKETAVVLNDFKGYQQSDFNLGEIATVHNNNIKADNAKILENNKALADIRKGRPNEQLSEEEKRQVNVLVNANKDLIKDITENKKGLINATSTFASRDKAIKEGMGDYDKVLWDKYYGGNPYGVKDGDEIKASESSPAMVELKKKVEREKENNKLRRANGEEEIFTYANEYATAKSVLTQGAKNANNWRTAQRNYEIQKTPTIALGTNDAKAAGDRLLQASGNLKIYDADNNEVKDVQKGDWNPFNNEGGLRFDNGKLYDYLIKNKGKMEVVRVIPSAGEGGIGNGNPIAVVKFNDPKIDEKKEFFVPLPDEEVVGNILNPLLTSRNKEVVAAALNTMNPVVKQVKKLFLFPVNTEGKAVGDDLGSKTDDIQIGTMKYPTRVTPTVKLGGGVKYMVEMRTAKGWEPIPAGPTNPKGQVTSPEHFTQILPDILGLK